MYSEAPACILNTQAVALRRAVRWHAGEVHSMHACR